VKKYEELNPGSIEKGIPVPPPRGGRGKINPLKERIIELEVGDSFYVEFPPDSSYIVKLRIRNNMSTSIQRLKTVGGGTYAGRKFTMRNWQTEAREDSPATEGCRIWRIEDRNT
jgi:hypothetical protein|tara:strand:- start:4017 stop:4358 length:342 start_codon:yes stop_codon:yes gene_type:complete